MLQISSLRPPRCQKYILTFFLLFQLNMPLLLPEFVTKISKTFFSFLGITHPCESKSLKKVPKKCFYSVECNFSRFFCHKKSDIFDFMSNIAVMTTKIVKNTENINLATLRKCDVQENNGIHIWSQQQKKYQKCQQINLWSKVPLILQSFVI